MTLVPTARPTGLDLRLRRVAAGVTQTAIAKLLGVPRSSVSNVEALARPTKRAVERYVRALQELADR